MRMKPILFNTEMVKAILDGRKTVTRRLVKTNIVNQFDVENDNRTVVAFIQQSTGDSFKPTDVAPYKIGDVLYVRETWSEWTDGYAYKVPDNKAGYNYPALYIGKWKPSIHMPKEAARIFLQVADVRVERLQGISEEQAIKEGTPYELCGGWKPTFYDPDSGGPDPDFIDGFSKLWDSTVDMKNHWMDQSWGANPWVWVIEFQRVEKPM